MYRSCKALWWMFLDLKSQLLTSLIDYEFFFEKVDSYYHCIVSQLLESVNLLTPRGRFNSHVDLSRVTSFKSPFRLYVALCDNCAKLSYKKERKKKFLVLPTFQ